MCMGVVVAELVSRQGVRVSVKAEDSVWFSWMCVFGVKAKNLKEVRKIKNRGVGGRKE